MLVKDILERVTTLYNDQDYVRVTPVQYLQFLDDAINQVILSRPDAHVKTAIVQLVKGTRQSIPTEGYSLIDIYMNKIPAGGGTYDNGAPVFQVDREDLDYFTDWHSMPSDPTEISEFAYDSRSPRTYWVSPPVGNTTVHIEMDYSYGCPEYAKMTEEFEDIGALEIPMPDVFKNAIVAYVLFLLYSTDSTSVNDRQVAQRYEQIFYQALGLEYKASIIVMPKIMDVDPVQTTGATTTNG